MPRRGRSVAGITLCLGWLLSTGSLRDGWGSALGGWRTHRALAAGPAIHPDVLVIGGGIAVAGNALMVPTVAELKRYAQRSH